MDERDHDLIVLRDLINDREVERALMTLKTRASAHDPRIRTFWIGSSGITFDPPGSVQRAAPRSTS